MLTMGGGSRAADSGKDPPLPRFVSLRFDQVNLRAGPGDQYPIEWVLTKKGLPVEIIGKFDVWWKIRDWQGSVGWVRERMVTASRTVVITGQTRVLHADPDADAPAVAKAEAGVIARLLSCRAAWCRVQAQGVKGWIERGEIWGVLPDEAVE